MPSACTASYGRPAIWMSSTVGILTQDIVTQFGQPPYRIDLLDAIDGVTFAEVRKGAVAIVNAQHPARVIGLAELRKNKRASGRKKDEDDLRRLDSLR